MPEGAGKKSRERQPVYALTRPLYQRVIDDTCSKMKSEFVERGISEYVVFHMCIYTDVYDRFFCFVRNRCCHTDDG